MLIITRKPQQQIRIGDNIVITFIEFRGNSIRLGVDAPKDVKVLREELVQQTAVEIEVVSDANAS